MKRNIMADTKFKEGDILVSDSENIISVLKGDYNNGKFRDYACIESEVLDIYTTGVWDGITDWRLATAKEKEKLYSEIEIRKKCAERDLEVITKLKELIQIRYSNDQK